MNNSYIVFVLALHQIQDTINNYSKDDNYQLHSIVPLPNDKFIVTLYKNGGILG